jgi:hypothetical protein
MFDGEEYKASLVFLKKRLGLQKTITFLDPVF